MAVAIDCKIHNSQPTDCPPTSAQQVKKTLYRALKGDKACNEDFLSDAEKNRKGCDFSACCSYGWSVWTSTAGVATARLVVPGFRKKCIVKFDVELSHGKLLKTPTKNQPEHHTYWRVKSLGLPPTHSIFLKRGSP